MRGLRGRDVGLQVGSNRRRRGTIRGMESRGSLQIIAAMIPLAETFGYTTTLRSLSQGRATSSMEFDHYAEVSAEVVQKQTA